MKMPLSAEKVADILKVFEGVTSYSFDSTNLRSLLSATSYPAPGGGFLGAWPQGYLKSNWDRHWNHLVEDDQVRLT